MSKPADFSQQSSTTTDDTSGADAARGNLKKLANAESDPSGTAKRLQAEGDAMAKKHGE